MSAFVCSTANFASRTSTRDETLPLASVFDESFDPTLDSRSDGVWHSAWRIRIRAVDSDLAFVLVAFDFEDEIAYREDDGCC